MLIYGRKTLKFVSGHHVASGAPQGHFPGCHNYYHFSARYFHPGSEPLELDAHFWALRDSIVQCELLVLRVLRFQVSFQHPHKV